MFNLYPQSFREGSKTSIVSTLNYKNCYYNGISYGGIEVTKLCIAENETEFEIPGNDEDILCIDLDTNLHPDKSIEIYIEYKVTP